MEDVFQLGVEALITNDVGYILLLKVNVEQLQNTQETYWDIPGGRIHRGDTIENTLKREVEEETGITAIREIKPYTMVLSNIRIPTGESDTGLILAIYECVVDNINDIEISEEHTEYAWVDREAAAKLLQVKYPEEFTATLLKK